MQKTHALENLLPIFVSSSNKQKKALVLKPVKPFWLWISTILIVLNTFLFISFLSGVNSYSSTGYEIKKLQSHLNQLSEENKKLSLKVAESSSIVAIEDEFLNEYFVSADTPQFLEVSQYSQR